MINEAILTRLALGELLDQYITAIDADRLEDWPTFFVDECLYEIIPRENVKAGLPAPVMRCEGLGMLKDRVVSLRNANIYEEQNYRHVLSGLSLTALTASSAAATANYVVFNTDTSGRSTLYQTGQYEDVFVRRDGIWKIKSKRVIYDTSRVQTLLAYPI